MTVRIGQVIFVGAGPGDPDLITVAGVNALKSASVVLYDFLVPVAILEFAEKAEKIVVGKSRGHHSKKQEDINDLLIRYALLGHTVVRLKGGDPSIFGRLGEEMEILSDAKIPFKVVPGVTSGTAAAIYSGIPLTYREMSRSIAFVTASTFSNVDALGDIHIPVADTIVFFMPLAHLDDLTRRIPTVTPFTSATPAAIVSHGTTNAHQHIIGTVGSISERSRLEEITSPSVLIVGEVCRFADRLGWFTPGGGLSPFNSRIPI